jgi:hypothetical protein
MQQKNPPKCVVLRTSDGDDLGFMLTAVADGASGGECVFMVLPRNPALFDSPVARALFARKDVGESKVELTRGELLTIRVISPDLPDLLVDLNDSGSGSWRESSPGTASGLAAAAAAAEPRTATDRPGGTVLVIPTRLAGQFVGDPHHPPW